MPQETRTFRVEIEITARADIDHGGSSAHDSDEPPWCEVTDINIDMVDVWGHVMMLPTGQFGDILKELAYEEFR
jgi:hypothetical protein